MTFVIAIFNISDGPVSPQFVYLLSSLLTYLNTYLLAYSLPFSSNHFILLYFSLLSLPYLNHSISFPLSHQGISAKNVTLGVPRLNEILNVAKNIKTPSVTINIRKADDEEEASDLISQVR